MPANVSLVNTLANLSTVSAPAPQAGGTGFAQMLKQQREPAPQPTREPAPKAAEKKPAEKPAEKERVKESTGDTAAEAAAKAKAAERAKEKNAADKSAAQDKPTAAEGDTTAAPSEATAEATSDVETDERGRPVDADPAVADFMAVLQRANAPSEAGDALVGDATATEGETTPAAPDAAGRSPSKTSAMQGQALDRAAPAAADPAAHESARAAAGKADFAAQLASELRGGAEPAAARVDGLAGAHAPVGAQGAAAAAGPSAASATVAAQATVPVPTDSPEFPQALGVQVSLFAKQGVQEAELHLNPAEMGPITVQIALDGSKAQVDFSATSAQTRQLLENGLPELASSLREAGLTLSGGGVFQQPRQARDGQDGQGDGSSGQRRVGGVDGGREGAEAAPVRRNVRVSAGGVDLYA